jgi:hypothetical protein
LQGYSPLHHINFKNGNFQLTGLAWSEIGFSFATNLYHRYGSKLDAGIAINGLFGVSGGFVKVNEIGYM